MDGYTLYATLTDTKISDGNILKVSREDEECIKIELMDNKNKVLGEVMVNKDNLLDAIQETTKLREKEEEEHND